MGNLPIEEGIHIHSENSVAYVGFAHPKQNAFPATHLEQLQHAFVSLAKKPDIHVIVLYSDPTKVFCAGASFDELLQVKTPEQGKQFFMGFSNVINAMRQCPQPIIGRIHGPAVGGGVGLVSACDYALATTDTRIKLSEIAIGIGPFVIAPAVQRKIGTAALSELSLSAHAWKSADWAHQKGLLAELHPDLSTLDQATNDMAQRLAGYAPKALIALKKALWQGTEHWGELLSHNAAVSGQLVLSEKTQQTLNQLKNKK
jgi:methylglutaconyl-CoA hydratase